VPSSIEDMVTEDRPTKENDESVDLDEEVVKDAPLSFRDNKDKELDEEAEGATEGRVFWFTEPLEDLDTMIPEAGTRCVTVLTVTRLDVAPD